MMFMEIIGPFLISLFAGLSTLLGVLFICFKPKNINSFIGISLSFSATIMILISITELIPEGFFYLQDKYNIFLALIILILMIFIGNLLNKIINRQIEKSSGSSSNLFKVGILSMLALMIHNLPEGILTFLSGIINIKLGIKYGIAIMLHNIPEGIAIAVPIYYSTYSKKKAVKGTLLSGLSEPLGAVIAYLFLYKYISNTMISIILLFVAGIMISISINDIYEESLKYKKKSFIVGVIVGIVLFIINEILFS